MQSKANYGIDAPPIVAGFFAAGVIGLVGTWAVFRFVWPRWHWLAAAGVVLLGFVGVQCLWITIGMVRGSLVKKPQMRDKMLDSFAWKGDEKVLDVGCGRGLLVIGAAKRLPRGRAFGVDLWRGVDQSGNSDMAVKANARAEGVEDRIELRTADFRQIPFPDQTFDAVVSSLAIHNVPEASERSKALAEIVRVLKPGGRVAIWDIQHTEEYQEFFKKTGLQNIVRDGPVKIFYEDYLVTAQKPT